MKFSIIVPVYNVSKYIVDCVESIEKQEYESYEVILVDDGSTDESGLICDWLWSVYISLRMNTIDMCCVLLYQVYVS